MCSEFVTNFDFQLHPAGLAVVLQPTEARAFPGRLLIIFFLRLTRMPTTGCDWWTSPASPGVRAVNS